MRNDLRSDMLACTSQEHYSSPVGINDLAFNEGPGYAYMGLSDRVTSIVSRGRGSSNSLGAVPSAFSSVSASESAAQDIP